MLDRIRIWEDKKTNSVHYEVKDENGVPCEHGSMASIEWTQLTLEMIKQLRSVAPQGYKFPRGSAFIINYLVALSLIAETS